MSEWIGFIWLIVVMLGGCLLCLLESVRLCAVSVLSVSVSMTVWSVIDKILQAGCQCKAAFTLIRVRVRVCLHGSASIALYCKQCFITWTLKCHNNDTIIDVRTFSHLFWLFSCRKEELYTKLLVFQGNSCSYTEPVLLWTADIVIHANSCLQNTYMATRTLTHISVNPT